MTFDRFRFCKGNIGGTPRNKEETPKGRSNRFFYPPPCRVPWHYGVSCNNRREMHKTILMPKHKMPLSILSPCVSVREYRGSARRARGLNSTIKKSYTPKTMTAFSISAQKLPFLRQPLYIAARKVQRTDNSKNINISLFFLKKFDHAINNRHTGSTFA